ncbi:Kae1-associated serine/threonine protein kinase [Candidatus Woesearchaeota archaeon]|nr:Kae1-associated serine/threonine protein kinase [Candidatus Woesearchaeota archaeon]
MGSIVIGRGAEAIITKVAGAVVKERPCKGYRLSVIDEKLRKQRTRKEANLLEKLEELGIPAPRLLDSDDRSMRIEMSFLDGPKVRDVLDPVLAFEIGKLVGLLHKNDIVHADLTTSNMILCNEKVHLIDFGLSFVSVKLEDKAVDLHLLDRALESKHHDIYSECLKQVISGYKDAYPTASVVLDRLAVVQKRGRNKK